MSKSRITYNPKFNNLPIQAYQQQQLGCHTEILQTINTIFTNMVAKHNKVFFMRFDVTFPDQYTYPSDNIIFQKFMANFIKSLNRKGLDPQYIWCREKHYSTNHHYHCILLLNGSFTQSIYGHLSKAEELWARALDISLNEVKGLIDYCNRGSEGFMIRRGDRKTFDYCFEWASYLAKANTKENIPGVRKFGSSLRRR